MAFYPRHHRGGLTYTHNTETEAGVYTAEITGLGNANYTLDGVLNARQGWCIIEENEHITLTGSSTAITYGDALTLTVNVGDAGPESDRVAFYNDNGDLLGTVALVDGTAVLTVKATSEAHFFAGANMVMALLYSGIDGMAAITAAVNPKAVTARIADDRAKTYDGHNTATGLALELEGAEACDRGLVYTGQPVNVNAMATELIPGDECEVTVENGQQINPGTYVATATELSNSNYALPDAGTTREYTIAQGSSSGGSHGSWEVYPKDAEPGDVVTIFPTPDPGYEVDSVVVRDKDGNELGSPTTATARTASPSPRADHRSDLCLCP